MTHGVTTIRLCFVILNEHMVPWSLYLVKIAISIALLPSTDRNKDNLSLIGAF